MPDSYKSLRRNHNYTNYAPNCYNCEFYKQHVELMDGSSADICIVDFDTSLSEEEQPVHIMHKPFGVCDEHQHRTYKRRKGYE